MMLPSIALMANRGNNLTHKDDTVIIELNSSSKIVIYTKTKDDLIDLERYDINQIIADLNVRLEDSVKYLEIDSKAGQSYLKEKKDTTEEESDNIRLDFGNMTVEIDPNEMDDFENDWESRRKTKEIVERADRTTHHFNIDLGVNNWLEDGGFPDEDNAPYTVKPWGSWYIALNSVNVTWLTGPVFLEWGGGFSWYSWKLQDPDFRITEGSERVELNVNPDENGIKSKLTASYLNVHLVPMFDFGRGRRKLTSIQSQGVRIKRYARRGFRFGIGGYAGYRLGSHTKFKFNNTGGGTEKERERDNFFLENFRYGLRAQIGWKGVEFFANYDLNEVFSTDRGPEGSPGLNAISFGVTL